MKYLLKPLYAAVLFTLATGSFAENTTTATTTEASTTNVAVSPEERAKIEQVVHDYLLKKPEVIVETLQILQRRQYEQAEQTVKLTQQTASSYANALFHNSKDPVMGNPNGAVTVVEFFDYQCPHCIDMVPVLDTIVKTNPNVRVVLKEFPIRGPMSELAARAALAANKQGKYDALSHALLNARQPLTEDFIYQTAAKNGINVDQLKKDMADKTIENAIKDNVKLAQDLKLFGTPAIFIAKTDVENNKGSVNYVPGQMDTKQLQKAIDQAGK